MRVMVVCGHNACRSQMAEGFFRVWGQGKVSIWSAGIEAGGLDPRAVAAMAECGIDISGQTSDRLEPELMRTMDVVITVCDDADVACPVVSGVRRVSWPIADPAAAGGDCDQVRAAFSSARDEIAERVRSFLTELEEAGGTPFTTGGM